VGRRKTSRFGWVRGEDDDEGILGGTEPAEAEGDTEADEAPGRTQGSIHRLKMDELGELVLALSRLPPSARKGLPIDDEAKAELELLAKLGPTPARRRQALRARLFFRDLDPAPLLAVISGKSPREAELQQVERWRKKLLAGGDEALGVFLAESPGADAQRIRAAVREAQGEGPAAARAFKRLFKLVAEGRTTSADEPAADGGESED
jgi:ribosome-associated protein